MKPQDVIEQLVGTGSGWDQLDTMAFTIYNPSKFSEAGNAEIDFEKGIVNLYNKGDDENLGKVSKSFAIVAKLEPCDPPKKASSEEGDVEEY